MYLTNTSSSQGLAFFETSRGPEKESPEWLSRQLRKVYGVIKALDELVKSSPSPSTYLVGGEFTIADIAAGAMLGMFDMVETKFGLIKWKEDYPKLVEYWQGLEKRESFKETKPVMFELKEKVA